MARVCFGRVCATTSARFAKVLQGTEKAIFAQGERKGERSESEALAKRARAGQAGVAGQHRHEGHIHEVSEERMQLKQERERRERREEAERRAEKRPVWHSEWKHIFGSHGR
uniref:Uncharacterized protein n=2 Tax=Hemiselmis andersenii TaxID=464988 RepID=A0A7S0XWL6_HEMAN